MYRVWLMTLLVLVVGWWMWGLFNPQASVMEKRATVTSTDNHRSVAMVRQISSGLPSHLLNDNFNTSLDFELQEMIYSSLADIATAHGYEGGSGVVMDVRTGELIALVSYSSQENDTLFRPTEGLYIPGSIIKPFVALAALQEGTVDPEKEIVSTGKLEVPAMSADGSLATFNDWKAHGPVDMREAIGVSSNVYFYTIGGGFDDQPGVGIERIIEYERLFGIGTSTGIAALPEATGQLPTPEWKMATYGDEWRLADTYLAAIGQHGYAVTPLSMTRAVAAIGTRGTLVTPTLRHHPTNTVTTQVPIAADHFRVVQEGMEYAVMNGTAAGLYFDDFTLAAKTGTAEVDSQKDSIHSWLIGYFPHDEPRYAFTFMLERGPWGEETGAVALAAPIFRWITRDRPNYYQTQ